MKKFLFKYASAIAALALVITTVNANSTCYCEMHQDSIIDRGHIKPEGICYSTITQNPIDLLTPR